MLKATGTLQNLAPLAYREGSQLPGAPAG